MQHSILLWNFKKYDIHTHTHTCVCCYMFYVTKDKVKEMYLVCQAVGGESCDGLLFLEGFILQTWEGRQKFLPLAKRSSLLGKTLLCQEE